MYGEKGMTSIIIHVIWLVIKVVLAYDFTCPHPGQWNLIAETKNCSRKDYVCLLDDVKLKDTEACKSGGPRIENNGFKAGLNNGYWNAIACSSTRFQPLQFSSFKDSRCVFEKSLCSEEGQVLADTGTAEIDRSCRCNYVKGYAFLANTSNLCSCIPSEEDCTCFRKPCSIKEILSQDYKCIKKTELQGIHQCTSISDRESIKPDVVSVNDTVLKDYNKVNIYAATCSIIILVISIVFIVNLTLVFHRKIWTALRKCCTCCTGILVNKGLEDQNCYVGDSVTFICEVNQNNIPGIWHKDGVELKPSDSISITVDGRIHKLVLHSVTANARGNYSCHIKDKEISSSKLSVNEVTFVSELRNLNCSVGDSITFTCEINEENLPGKWIKDGVELKPSDSISITVDGRTHKLVLNSVTANGSGNYSCQIKDKESSSELTVNEVIILKPLEDQNCIEGKSVTFTCEVNQVNVPGKWRKDGVELKPSYSMSITVDGRIHKLVLYSVTANARGYYSCHIQDKESVSKLTVNEVILARHLEDQHCTEGGSVTFICEVNHEDIPGKWRKDGVELKPCKSISITVDGRFNTLVLHSVTAKDSGNYSCQIKDKESSSELTVNEVRISKPFEEQKNHFEGDKVTFTCEVNSEVLRGTWFKDGQELSVSDNLDIITKGRIREIVILGVTFNDRGYYSFKIKDETTGVLLVVLDKITPDKINYIRLYQLLETVAEPVVREIFDREIHPNQLRKILNQNSPQLHSLKLQKHINIREYDLLYPLLVEYSVKFKIKNYDCKRINQNKEEESQLRTDIECAVSDLYSNVKGDHKVTVVAFEPGSLIVVLKLESTSAENNLKKILKTAVEKGNVGSFETESSGFKFTRLGNVQAVSTDFDIRLMMVLMKNLTELNIADVFPHENDLTVVADLSRIKYLRNRIVQNSDRSIKDEDFAKDWKHLSEAVERLGGKAYKKKCEELKNLNPTLQHVQEYLTSENLQSNQGQTSNDSLRDFFLENEVNNLFARNAVRQIFDKQFPPQKLAKEIESRKKELAALKEERKITQSQWDDLFPSDKESLSSSGFDIKVMIILLSSTSFKEKDVFKAIENLQNHISKPEYDDKAIKKAIKEINEVA